jgi:hypothetical protein
MARRAFFKHQCAGLDTFFRRSVLGLRRTHADKEHRQNQYWDQNQSSPALAICTSNGGVRGLVGFNEGVPSLPKGAIFHPRQVQANEYYCDLPA